MNEKDDKLTEELEKEKKDRREVYEAYEKKVFLDI